MDENKAEQLRERMFRERHKRFMEAVVALRRMKMVAESSRWGHPLMEVRVQNIILYKESLAYLSNFFGEEFKQRCDKIYNPDNMPEGLCGSNELVPIKDLITEILALVDKQELEKFENFCQYKKATKII